MLFVCKKGNTTERILVVDDRPIERRLLATLLSYRGYVVLEASDGAEALSILRAKRPCLVITDVLMPEMDGYELVRQVRQDPALRALPVILYTATYGGQAAQALAGACGATAFLAKPAEPSEILRAVETALGASSPVNPSPRADLDRAHLRLVSDKLVQKVAELEAVSLRLAALVDFGQQLCAERDPGMQMEKACAAAADIIRAHRTAVGLLESDGVSVRRYITTESDGLGEPAFPQVLLAGRRAARTGSVLAAAVATSSRVFGWLQLANKVGADEFSDDDERLAVTLASQLALALESAERLQGLQRASAESEDRALQLERQTVELVEARDEALASSRAKSQFLANVSHEIRTPLNAVFGMTELLLDTALAEEQRERVLTIRRSGQTLLAMINDILDVSKIGAGKLRLETVDVDLRSTVEGVVRLLAPLAHEKGLTITSVVPAALPDFLRGDPGRIRQVLTNLIGNAVKFTAHGGVSVTATLLYETATHAMVELSVEDTGIGIPREQHETIFEIFTQGDASTTRRYGGTGLGLSICRQLVALMDGDIGLESEPAKGSRFWVRLCLEKHRPAIGEPPVEAPTPAGRDGVPLCLRVLVVDDDRISRVVTERMLERLGCRIDAAANGREALEALGRDRYDVVLMDVQMPEMDGFDATAEVRRREASTNTGRRQPIVALTADALSADREACLARGMDDCLVKPVGRAELRAVLARWAPTTSEAPEPAGIQAS